ncbi:MAG: acyltransferase [Lachnospiraceae bacterium]|nr:acyltransferase [Lachnospiraceae bacterium]
MKTEVLNERNHTLNYIKALACFCVLMLHCGFPGIIGKFIYGPSRFAVPFFFMVSGYYVYSQNTSKVLSKLPRKIKHIAVLLVGAECTYLIWHIIQSAIEGRVKGVYDWFTNTFTVEKGVRFIIFQTTPVGDVSWFLVALILCYIVTYPIAKYNLWNLTIRMIPVLLLINIIFGEVAPFWGINVQWYWCSNFWLLGFPFYAMGYWVRRKQNELCVNCSVKSTALAVILSIILITIERVFTSANQFFIGNIFLALSLFLFSIRYPSVFKEKYFVENIGEKYSVYIYILHPVVRDILYGLILEYLDLTSCIIMIWGKPIFVFVACIGISIVIDTLGSKHKILANKIESKS